MKLLQKVRHHVFLNTVYNFDAEPLLDLGDYTGVR